MKTLGAIAILAGLLTAGCGYHHPYGQRAEIRRAREDFRRAAMDARAELRQARRDLQYELRQAREQFRREMRQSHRDFRREFDHGF